MTITNYRIWVKLLLSFIFTFLLIMGTFAQEIQFTASAKTRVSVGDRFQLIYTVNANGGDFKGPEIKDFRVLSGPNLSTSQNYQVINGKMTQSVSVSYIYYLQAFKEGSFDIPSATIVIDGKTHTSRPVKVNVIKGNAPVNTQGGQQNTGGEQTGEMQDDVFLRAYISNPSPYQGQQVIITYKIFTTTVSLSEIDHQHLFSYPGFWSTSLTNPNERLVTADEVINGRQYTSAILYKAALVPQKSGEIVIEPKKVECTAQVRTQGNRQSRDNFFDNFFDDPFFNNRYQNVRLSLESNPVKLNVKPLPMEGKPSDFSGAVGNFKISSTIDKTELTVNDAITLKLVISGSGNLELINTPVINWPPDFETYEPKVSKNIKTGNIGVSGSRSFEFLAIPRSAGDFTIGPIELSYFDPSSGKYHILRTEAYELHVEKGDQQSSSVTYSGVAQEDIKYLGQDIRYIKTGKLILSTKGDYLFASTLFYLMLAVPVVVLLLLSILITSNRKRRGNIALVKNRKATKVARKNLRKASEFLKGEQREEFYLEVSRALWGYLSNKFNIPLSDLSMDTVKDRLSNKSVSSENIDSFIEVLNKCEFARFAPGESTQMMNEIYEEAITFISRIESELKS